jgi:hypothetical protein
VSNAAVVVLKPAAGEILAMVGSLDYFDSSIQGQVNIATRPRQPGSAIKPVTYAAAMERGWTTGDVIWDVPIALELAPGEEMVPVNYDHRYHGPVLFRDALANSYNIPPLQLARDIGIPALIATARKMGIESLREMPGYYGLAITLGGGEVTLLELTHAYATLANQGQRPHLTGVLRIVDSWGNVIYDAGRDRVPPANALDPRIAYIISDILDDDEARVPAMGRNNPMHLLFPVAAKTGTTTDFRDNWIIGYTPGVVVGAWMGNADGRPMRDSSGLRGVAPAWRRILETLYSEPAFLQSLTIAGELPASNFVRPAGIEERPVCLPRGTGGGSCSLQRNDLFLTAGPARGIPRLGYLPDTVTNPGAWTLAVLPLANGAAQSVMQPALSNGFQPPPPTECVVHALRPPEGASIRLYLPIPPYYPDEVRARLWAQQNGYQMAPPVACPAATVREAVARPAAEAEGSDGSSAPAPGNAIWRILSPTAGQRLSGLVPILGTATFSTAEVQYYKLEIGSGSTPTEWTTFGTIHGNPVVNGTLEHLHAYALPPGDYVIRLVIVRHDGNFPTPHAVPVTIVP